MTQKSVKAVQLAYGGMALKVFEALNSDARLNVRAIVTPETGKNIYRNSDELPQELAAKQSSVEVIPTANLKTLHKEIERLRPDIVVIATFPKIIPPETLNLSRFINIHHGKLPRQRGRANVNWALINDEPSVSVSIHEAIPELDAGDIIRQFHIEINEKDSVADLYDRINETLQKMLPDLCIDYLDGNIACQEQDQSRATYYCTRLPRDGLIDWTRTRKQVTDLVRALSKPFPGAYTYLDGTKLIVWAAEVPPASKTFEGIVPGRVISCKAGTGVEVLVGDGPVLLRDVETKDFSGDPSKIIKSSFVTLGLNPEDLLDKIAELEQRLHDLTGSPQTPKVEKKRA